MAKHKELAKFYGLIMNLAKSHYYKASPGLKRVIELDDLFREGVIGAIVAIDTFKPGRAPKTAWVRLKANGRILDSIQKLYPFPPKIWKKIKELMKAKKKLLEKLGREPSYEELANHINVAEKTIREIEMLSKDHVHIDTITIIDEQQNQDAIIHVRQLVKCIHACIESDLTEQEGFAWIERKIYGRPAKEIGEKIRVATPLVYGIVKVAKKKLKRCLKNKGWQEKDLPDILK